MNLVKYEPKSVWDPFSDLWDLRSEMNRIFDTFFGRPIERTFARGWHPAVDIYEEKDHYIVKAELPGVKQDDIKILLTDSTLTLRGERKSEHEEKHEGYHRLERAYGEFQRSFQLPTEVDADKIKATYKDGILEIEIPKSEKAKPREISIKVE
jgi:HSP20 family protein